MATALDRRSNSLYQPRPLVPVRHVQEAVADYYGIAVGDLVGPDRSHRLVAYRHLAMYLARETSDLSLPDLGRAFRRDHTTVLYAIRRVTADLASDPVAAEAVETLRAQLLGPLAPVLERSPLAELLATGGLVQGWEGRP